MPLSDLHLVTTNSITSADTGTPSGTIQDSIIASSLISAPAWSSWLNYLNGWLTTLSLIIGLLIGVHRLWIIIKTSKSKSEKSISPKS